MREILFRGKRLDNGEWVYGFFWKDIWGDGESCYIFYDGEDYPVIPDTVGQYTGLTDENSVKIYDGDIVKFEHGREFDERGIYFRNYVVEFINTYMTYGLRLRNGSIHFTFKQSTATTHDAMVIGNIHDNPELIEGDAIK